MPTAPTLMVALLTVLAVVPAIASSPGVMPADSKLYLYLNPGRLLSDVLWSFDARQFGGWVPHQHIAFGWPSGPWYWVAAHLQIPDWIAHRLWIAALFLLAGLGAARSARLLGLGWAGATIAALVVQLSPYTLAYASRTSVMLLPWAGLGWLLAATIQSSRHPGWRHPARAALIVLTIGAVNPTALAMVAPVPVLWLVHAAASRLVTWRAAVVVAARIGLGALGVSAWWIAMVVIQARYGAPVLRYSETLADVSSSATAPEVLRGLGYWLFYVRDQFGPATSAAARHLSSPVVVAASVVLPILGVWAMATTRWVHRGFTLAMVAVGVVLAVGVHPIDAPSPLMSLVVENDLALALRSSTRAVPMIALGFGLILGARLPLIGAAWSARHPRIARVRLGALVSLVLLVTLVNQPALWTRGLVDPLLSRDADPPAAWRAAATAADGRPSGFRTLQIPGAEFGSFRWGHTIDQPLVALGDRPLLTRDLLPLGSGPAMDLLYAFDDRLQLGTLPAGALAPVARLMGADIVWLTNDLAHERYLTVRPETLIGALDADTQVSLWANFGADKPWGLAPERVDVISLSDPAVGAAVPQVMLWEVSDPVPVIRARTRSVAIAGSGDGIIDAAGAGLISGHELLLVAAEATPAELAAAERLIITDSPRERPRHWRSSQDVLGATRARDPDLQPLTPGPGDEQLPAGAHLVVTAEQLGPVRATASAYGEPFAYLPEMRPAMAIDGDLSTAWRVGGRSDPRGERLRLWFAEAPTHLRLVQPSGGRWIEEVVLEFLRGDASHPPRTVTLDARSHDAPGQVVDLPDLRPGPAGAVGIDIVITAVSDGPPEAVGFAAVAEIASTEFLVLPDAPRHHHPVVVLTRDRVDPRLMHRSDPEPFLHREFALPAADASSDGNGDDRRDWMLTAQISLDARSSDEELALHLPTAAVASTRLRGVVAARGHSAVDGDPRTAWISDMDAGMGARLEILDLTAPIDRLRIEQAEGEFSRITEVVVRGAGPDGRPTEMRVPVDAAEIALPSTLGPGPLEMEVTGLTARTLIDPRDARVRTAPIAITEIHLPRSVRVQDPEPMPDCIPDLLTLNGQSLGLRVGRDLGQATACTPLAMGPGRHRLSSQASAVRPGLLVDQVVLQPTVAAATAPIGSGPVVTVREGGRVHRLVEIHGCADGCWVVLGEGFSPAWSAHAEGRDLGPGRLVDGMATGWYLPADNGAATRRLVEFRWTAQRPLTMGFALSAVMIVLCGWWARPARGRTRSTPTASASLVAAHPAAHRLSQLTWAPPVIGLSRHGAHTWGRAALWILAAGAFVGPWWMVPAAALSALQIGGLRGRIPEVSALGGVVLGYGVWAMQWLRRAPAADLAWPAALAESHGLMMFAIVTLVVALWPDPAEPQREPQATLEGVERR